MKARSALLIHFRRLAREDGSNLVETALSIGLLLTFLFGIIEISLAGYTYHFISEAARAATRYAMVRGSACNSWGSACPASSTDIQNYVKGLNYPGISSSKMTVNVSFACYPVGVKCSATNAAGSTVQVQVQYKFPLAVPFVRSNTINMTSTSQMVIAN